jgi:SAM-dependent methyltransferase
MSFSAADWSQRYQSGDTPWDLGAPHPELVARIAEGLAPSDRDHCRALVAGCGRGHDALALARAGWRVTAVDLVDPTAGELNGALKTFGGSHVVEDALAHTARTAYDLIFEHTFFCAIDPSLRGRWGELVGRCLAQRAELCALVYPVGKPASEGGPPFGTTVEDMLRALGARFTARIDEPVRNGVARRVWAERWAVLRRAD